MALKSWLAALKSDVSHVSGVQAPIHAGLGRYVTETAGVSGVSGTDGVVASDTADTSGFPVPYQANPLIPLACTGDTADTCKTIDTEANAANELLSGELLTDLSQNSAKAIEPKRLFRQRGPWLTGTEQSAAKAYHLHHFHCHQCIAAGRGILYGRRCAVGLALWTDYTGANDLQTEGA